MKVSARGRAFIEKEEGCVLHAYSDAANEDPPDREPVWTIGVGHTGKEVVPGLIWTRQQADEALARDLMHVELLLTANCRPADMLQNEFDAMASLAFNIGGHAFLSSTVLRDYNQGDLQGAADAFLMWRKPPRLIPRRERERALFLTSYNNRGDV